MYSERKISLGDFVTILVFMELALQYIHQQNYPCKTSSHNPCFYGISFAIISQLIYLLNEYESQSLFLWN